MLCHFSGYEMFLFILLGFGTADVLASPAAWYLIGGLLSVLISFSEWADD